jgi:hypothetical protein
MSKLLPAPMRASKLLALQLTVIRLLSAVLTVKLSVDHPEWSPNGLSELRTVLPHRTNSDLRLFATP